MFARNAGGGSGGNGGGRRPDDFEPDYDAFDDDPANYQDEGAAPAPRGTRRGGGGGGGDQGGSAGGRQRTVQFQPEERYWTEYLRIALPVIGLLLMLGLFWFWAQWLIGDNNSKEPQATDVPGVVVTPTEQVNVPTATVETVTEATATQPPAPTLPAEPTATVPAQSPATPPPSTGTIAIGGTVVTTEADINMRPDASTAGAPIAVLASGETLTVIDGPVEAEGFTWWQRSEERL